jgi:alpha-N-arabinofuranosidase
VHYLDCSAILDEERCELKVFATNRSQDEEMDLSIDLADRAIARSGSAELLTGPDAKAANSFDDPNVIRPVSFEGIEIRDGRARASLPPLSLLAATLELE